MVKTKGKSAKGEARGRARAGSVPSREKDVHSATVKDMAVALRLGVGDRPAGTTAEVRAEAAALARSIAQTVSVGVSQPRDRGPAPAMPVPIATFNI